MVYRVQKGGNYGWHVKEGTFLFDPLDTTQEGGGRRYGPAMMIQIDHLTKRFGRRTVLDDVCFAAEAGAVTALVGHNGAGKTTMLRTAVGLVRPTEGTVRVAGVDVREAAGVGAVVGSMIDATALHRDWSGRFAVRLAAQVVERSLGSA